MGLSPLGAQTFLSRKTPLSSNQIETSLSPARKIQAVNVWPPNWTWRVSSGDRSIVATSA